MVTALQLLLLQECVLGYFVCLPFATNHHQNTTYHLPFLYTLIFPSLSQQGTILKLTLF